VLEQSEANAILDLVNAAPPDLDTTATVIGGIAVFSRPGPDASFWCQAVGFEAPPSADLIGEIVDHYRARGVEQARIALPPHAIADDWDDIATKYGLTPRGRSLKLAARLEPLSPDAPVPPDAPVLPDAPVPSDAPVSPVPSVALSEQPAAVLVKPGDYERWAQVMWGIFDMGSKANVAVTVASLEHPSLRAYACWDGDAIVATGLVRLHEDSAHLFSGATVDGYRGRGAQSAIIAARVAAAREAGCAQVVVETGVASDGYNTSARNLMRAGFEPRYERQTWLWTA
jgi:GNAT superfamily N-acetyltransferase